MIKFYLSNIKFLIFANIYCDRDSALTKCSDVIIVKRNDNSKYKCRLYHLYNISELHETLFSNNILQEDPDFTKTSNLEIYGLHIFVNEEELFYLKLKYSNDFY